MTLTVIAATLQESIPYVCKALSQSMHVQVFIQSDLTGYFARLKLTDKPVDQLTAVELKRELRKCNKPEAYDVALIPWPAFMYVGFDRGEKPWLKF